MILDQMVVNQSLIIWENIFVIEREKQFIRKDIIVRSLKVQPKTSKSLRIIEPFIGKFNEENIYSFPTLRGNFINQHWERE